MSGLTTDEIKKIMDDRAVLREKLRTFGAMVLSPTAEWKTLRNKVVLLNKKLKADTALKVRARRAAARGEIAV